MKKILLTILSLFLLTGCFSFREKSNSRPAITIDTDYLSGDASYLYYYQSLSSKEKEIYENIYNCIIDNAKNILCTTSFFFGMNINREVMMKENTITTSKINIALKAILSLRLNS